jgi:acetyltransferase-like isoleucine patch superfamily enzyme
MSHNYTNQLNLLSGTKIKPPRIDLKKMQIVSSSEKEKLNEIGIKVHFGSGHFILPSDIKPNSVNIDICFFINDGTVMISGVDEGCKLFANIEMRKLNGLVYFGKVKYQDSFYQIRLWNDNQFLFIGDGTTSNYSEIWLHESDSTILIGEECMISEKVRIMNSDMHYIFDIDSKKKLNNVINLLIEPRVWIGEGAMIVRCPKIGYGSIIGAKSLVRKEVPPKTVCAGIPAKPIRNNILWERAGDIKKSTIDSLKEIENR